MSKYLTQDFHVNVALAVTLITLPSQPTAELICQRLALCNPVVLRQTERQTEKRQTDRSVYSTNNFGHIIIREIKISLRQRQRV